MSEEVSPKGFLTPVDTRRISYLTKNAKLLSDLVYVSGKNETFTVPAGFETDWASIPWIFWNLPGFDSDGPAAVPAVLHDYLYSLRGGEPYNKSRRECDDIFLEAMQLVGVTWLNRHIIYQAVRLCGGIYSRSEKWKK